MARPTWSLAVVAVFMLTGCIDGPDGCTPKVSPRGAPADAPQQAGPQGDEFEILVIEALNRTPIAAASIIVFWNRDYIEPPEEEGDVFPDTPPIEYVFLRTGVDGRARANVPEERFFMVAAAADGFTEEWTDLGWPGDAPGSSIELSLLPATASAVKQGAFAGPVIVPPATGFDWRPVEFVWTSDAAIARDLANRLTKIEVELDWTVTTGQVADFGVGLGAESDSFERASNKEIQRLPGTYKETLVTEGEAGSIRYEPPAGFDEGVSWAGPYVGESFVSQAPIAFTVRASLALDTRTVRIAECGILFADSEHTEYGGAPADVGQDAPALPVVLVVAALAVAALAWKRESGL